MWLMRMCDLSREKRRGGDIAQTFTKKKTSWTSDIRLPSRKLQTHSCTVIKLGYASVPMNNRSLLHFSLQKKSRALSRLHRNSRWWFRPVVTQGSTSFLNSNEASRRVLHRPRLRAEIWLRGVHWLFVGDKTMTYIHNSIPNWIISKKKKNSVCVCIYISRVSISSVKFYDLVIAPFGSIYIINYEQFDFVKFLNILIESILGRWRIIFLACRTSVFSKGWHFSSNSGQFSPIDREWNWASNLIRSLKCLHVSNIWYQDKQYPAALSDRRIIYQKQKTRTRASEAALVEDLTRGIDFLVFLLPFLDLYVSFIYSKKCVECWQKTPFPT